MLNYLIISGLFVVLIGIQMKTYKKYFLSLPCLFTIYWAVLIIIGIGLYLNSFTFSYISFYWIFLMCAIYYGSFCAFYNGIPNHKIFGMVQEKQHYSNQQYIFLVFITSIVCIAMRVVGVIYYMLLNNINILYLVLPGRFSEVLNTLTLLKYNVIPVQFSNWISITNTVSFSGLLLLGFYCKDFSKKQSITCGLLAAFAFLFSMVIFASKADVIFGVLVFLSTLIVRMIMDEVDVLEWTKHHKKAVLSVFTIGLCAIAILTAFIVIRSQFQKSPLDGLKQYGFGMIPAFDLYFANLRPGDLSFGKYTFLGILDFLGFGDPNLPQGVYEAVELGAGNYPSNIFTAFRSLIDDFGLMGCFFIFLLLGWATAVFTRVSKKNKRNLFPVCALSFITLFLLNSFLISVGSYFSLCLAYVFFYMFMLILRGTDGYLQRKQIDIFGIRKK